MDFQVNVEKKITAVIRIGNQKINIIDHRERSIDVQVEAGLEIGLETTREVYLINVKIEIKAEN